MTSKEQGCGISATHTGRGSGWEFRDDAVELTPRGEQRKVGTEEHAPGAGEGDEARDASFIIQEGDCCGIEIDISDSSANLRHLQIEGEAAAEMCGDHAGVGDAGGELAELDGGDATTFAGIGVADRFGDVPEEDGAGIGCEVCEAFGLGAEGVPALVVGAEFAEAAGTRREEALGLALPAGQGGIDAREWREGGGVLGGGGEEVLGLFGEVGGGAEGEAGDDGTVDAGMPKGDEERGGIGEFRAGIAVHLGEGGVAIGELGAASGLGRGEEVGVGIDEAGHGLMVAGAAGAAAGWGGRSSGCSAKYSRRVNDALTGRGGGCSIPASSRMTYIRD